MSKKTERPLIFFVPSFVSEYIDMGYHVGNKWENLPVIPGLDELRKMGLGLYQERFMLDIRLQSEFISELDDCSRRIMTDADPNNEAPTS